MNEPVKSSNDKQSITECEEFSTPPSTPKSNGSPNDSLNKSSCQYATAKQNFTKQELFNQSSSSSHNQQPLPPSAPPRTRRKHQGNLLASKSDSSSSSSGGKYDGKQRLSLTNGLPPTPKVHMGIDDKT